MHLIPTEYLQALQTKQSIDCYSQFKNFITTQIVLFSCLIPNQSFECIDFGWLLWLILLKY